MNVPGDPRLQLVRGHWGGRSLLTGDLVERGQRGLEGLQRLHPLRALVLRGQEEGERLVAGFVGDLKDKRTDDHYELRNILSRHPISTARQ